MTAATDHHNFYQQLPAFQKFEEFCLDRHYHLVPDSWSVVITDIKGSTQAIRQGRCRDVNMAGAAAIAAVLNTLEGLSVPYVFGGDGATFLVPSDRLDAVRVAILRTQRYVRKLFDLELIAGAVDIKSLGKNGGRAEVAKYELSPGNTIAFFRGGALTLAEAWVKGIDPSGHPRTWSASEDLSAPNLEGLSCRWKPLPAKNGTIVSLLVRARDGRQASQVYTDVAVAIAEILAREPGSTAPVGEAYFKPSLRSTRFGFENIWRTQGLALGKAISRRLGEIAKTIVLHYAIKYEFKIGGFDPKTYKKELTTNSDFRKFDDTLRMVVDCSGAQLAALESFFEALREKGQIFYGLHRSNTALMTCLVFSGTQNRHVHFIDGSDGGYAIAATQLKEQIKADHSIATAVESSSLG